jgi:hypothetical protein
MHLPFTGQSAGAIADDPAQQAPAGRPLKAILGYARPSPIYRRRAFNLCLVIAGVVAGVLMGMWRGPLLWHRIELLYWQHRCMVANPADGGTVATDFGGTVSSYAGDAAFHRFYGLLSPPGDRGTPIVFVHEVRTPDGRSRLVAVQASTLDLGMNVGEESSKSLTVCFQSRVFSPGGLGHRPTEVLTRSPGSAMAELVRPTRVNAGRVDPSDASHFSFDGTFGDDRFVVDGWLRDDDTVALQFRRNPAITPAPPPGTPRRTAAP